VIGSRAALISAMVIRRLSLIGLESLVNLLLWARMGIIVGVFLTEAIGDRQFAIILDIESRLLHSIERIPPFLMGFATRALRPCFNDFVAREVAKDIVRFYCFIKALCFVRM